MVTEKKHENAEYLFEELREPGFEQSFFEKLPQLLTEKEMEIKKGEISFNDLEYVGDILGLDWKTVDKEKFKHGIEKELKEHGDTIGNNLVEAARIAIGHLKEYPDYYERLEFVEQEDFWDKIDRLYNEYSGKNTITSTLKNNIVYFVLSNIRAFKNKHIDMMLLLPESASKNLIRQCLIAGLVGSKVLFDENMEEFDRITISIYNELSRELNLKLDNSEEMVYNDIDSILKSLMTKAMNSGKLIAWNENDNKENFGYIAKGESGIVILDFNDLSYLVNTNGHLYTLERFLKGQ